MQPLLDKNLISTKEASVISGYSHDYLSRLARTGKVKAEQVGRTWVVDHSSLISFMEGQGQRKEELSRALARTRADEYRSKAKSSFTPRSVMIGKPLNAPVRSHLALHVPISLVRHSIAALAAVLVVSAGAYAAENVGLRPVAALATSLALHTADGFKEIARGFGKYTDEKITHADDVVHESALRVLASRPEINSAFPIPRELAVYVSYEKNTPETPREVASLFENASSAPALPSAETFSEVAKASALSFGANVRDVVVATPRAIISAELSFASSLVDAAHAILDMHARGVYAWVSDSPLVAKETVLAFYRVGETTGSVAGNVPRLALSASERTTHALADVSVRTAQSAVAADIAFGRMLQRSSESAARLTLAPFVLAGQTAYGASVAVADEGLQARKALQLTGFDLGRTKLADLVSTARKTLAASVSIPTPPAPSYVPQAAYNFGSNVAVATYDFVNGIFGAGLRTLAFLIEPLPPLALAPSEATPAHSSAVATTHTTSLTRYVTPQYITTGIDAAYVDARIDARIAGLHTLTFTNNDNSVHLLSDDHILLSATRGSFGTLDAGVSRLATTTVAGALSVSGDADVGGTLTAGVLSVSSIASSGAIAAPYFTATSTTATSTFPNLSSTNFETTNLALLGFTQGSVPFIGANGILAQDNGNFFWNDVTHRLGLGTTSPAVAVDIFGTDAIRLPVGTSGQRPAGDVGYVRFNTTTHQFEGFGDNAVWQGLGGGVTDTDQNTYITADTNNTNEDTLRFFTRGVERMTIKPGGAIGIGTNVPNASAILDISTTTAGLLPPRLTAAQKNAISGPAAGLMVYDSTVNKLNVFNGTSWKNVGATEINGEVTNGTTGSVLFIGDGGVLGQDAANLNYSTSTGRLGLGVASPTEKLEVNGVVRVGTADDAGLIDLGDTLTGSGNYTTGIFRGGLGATSGGGYLNLGAWNGIAFNTSGTWLGSQATRMVIDGTSGNVGIATTSPTTTLSVQGNQYTSGTAFFGGAITATSTIALTNYSGILSSNGASGLNARTLTGTAGQITVTNGDGIAGNPTFSLPSTLSLASASTTLLSVTQKLYVGGTSTTTIDSVGNVVIPSAATFTLGAMTQGSALFAGASGVVSQDNANYFYDATNHRLGLGTTTPGATLSVAGNGIVNGTLTAFGQVLAPYVIATSTTQASIFPYASTTAVSASSGVFAGVTNQSVIRGDGGISSVYGPTTVYGVSAASALTLQRGNNNGNNTITFNDQTASPLLTLGTVGNTGHALLSGYQSFLDLGTNTGGTALSIDTSGNVNVTSHLVPTANQAYNLGSVADYWNHGYINDIVTNNISSASTSISGTNEQSFTIDAQNPTADAQDISLVFYRGAGAPSNAVLSWDSTNKRFNFNQNAYFTNASASVASTTLKIAAVPGQTAPLTSWLDSLGNTLASVAASGYLGLGSTSPYARLSVGSSTPTHLAASSLYNSAYVSGDLEVAGTFYGTVSGAVTPGIGNNVLVSTNSSGVLVGTSTPSAANYLATSTVASSFPYASTTAISSSNLTSGRVTYAGTGGILQDSANLTFNGTTLTANALALTNALPIASGGTATTTFYNGGALFYNSTLGTISQAGDGKGFFWDETNKRLGIGTTSPYAQFSVFAGGDYASHAASTLFAIGSSTAGTATSTLFSVDTTGNATAFGTVTAGGAGFNTGQSAAIGSGGGFKFSGRSQIKSSADGLIELSNSGGTGFTRLDFGGTTSSFPALAVSGANLILEDASGGFASNLGIGSTTPYAKLGISGFTTGTPGIVADALSGFTGNILDLKLASSTVFSVNQAGQALASSGANSAPGFAFVSAANTGFFYDSGNTAVDLSIGGGTQWRFNQAFINSGVSNGVKIGGVGASATVPNIIPNFNDTTTGIGASASGALSLITNATDRIEITNGGLVGIGTTTPYAKLSVGGDVVIGASTAGGTLGNLYLPTLATPAGTFVAADATGKLIATSTPTLSTITGTLGIANGGTATTTGGVTNAVEYFNGTTLTNDAGFVHLPSGNVGIGTTTPFSTLSVSTTTQSSGLSSLFAVASSTNATLFNVLGNGNVGIGITAPAAQLDVSASASTVGLNLAGAALGVASASSGAAASNILTVVGAAGQATSFNNNSSRGGNGGALSLKTGAGGDNSDSNINLSGAHRGGFGGALTLTAGTGGNATNASGGVSGGTGGALTFTSGNGGTSAGTGTAGNAGAFTINGGAGGAASGAAESGSGATINLAAGNGGANANAAGTAGIGGSVVIESGLAGTASGGASAATNGTISIGISNASALSLGNSSFNSAITLLTGTSNLTLNTSQFVVNGTTGNVGIGSTTPAYKLSVEGSSTLGNQAIAGYFTATTTTASTFPFASTTQISATGNGYFATTAGGVGIGTTNLAGFALNVAGTGNFSNTVTGANFNAGSGEFYWNGKTALKGGVTDGNLQLLNSAENSFGLLQFGGTTSSFPAIKRNSAGIDFRLADDSGYANVAVGNLTVNGTTSHTGLASFANASTSLLSVTQKLYVGGTSTTTIDSAGSIVLPSAASLTVGNLTSGRVTYAGTGGILQDSANLTFNGTTLTANTLALTNALPIASGGTATTTFYNGGALFYNSSLGTISQASAQNGFFYDNTNARLGIGTSTPGSLFSIQGTNPNQFVVGYDTTHFGALGVSSAGQTTLSSSGQVVVSGASIAFNVTGNTQWTIPASTGDLVSATANAAEIARAAGNGTTPVFIPNKGDLTTGIGASASGALSLITNAVDRIEITNGGNVGIGSTTPYAKLGVSGFTTGTPGIVADALSGFTGKILDLKLASTTVFSVDQAGNVAISGTTSHTGLASFANASTSLLSVTNKLYVGGTATSTFDSAGVLTLASALGIASGGTATTTFYSGGIVFSDGAKLTQSSAQANFFWDETNKVLGIGTKTPTDVNANARLTVSGISSQDIIASTTDNTTLSDAILQAYAPGSRVFLGAHGTNQNTTQYGITVGGWGEIAAINSTSGTSNGLMIGTRTTAAPIVFGTNSLERMRILSSGNVGIGTTSPNATLHVAGAVSTQDLAALEVNSSNTGFTSDNSTLELRNVSKTTNSFSRLGFADNIAGSSNAMILGVYTDTTNHYGDLAFSTRSASGFTEKMRILSTGNVGIGTTTPGAKLDITGDASTGGAAAAIRFTETGNAASRNWLVGPSSGSNYGDLSFKVSSALGGNPLTSGTEVLTIKPSGNVGIGSTTPYAKLSVQGAGTGTGVAFQTTNSSDSPKFSILDGGNVGIGTTSPDSIFSVVGTGHFTTGFKMDPSSGTTYFRAQNDPIRADVFNIMSNYNGSSADDSSKPSFVIGFDGRKAADQFAISHGGNGSNTLAPIFTISTSTIGSNYGKLTLLGADSSVSPIILNSNGASQLNGGTVAISNIANCNPVKADSGGILNCSSDERLKDISGNYTTGLAAIDAINPIIYNWKSNSGLTNSSPILGFSAQNVQSVIPQAVTTDIRGFLQLSTDGIIVASVNAIKQLDARTQFVSASSTATSTTARLTVDPATGNIGIGTNTPHHTLDVTGDIAAISFVNTSTRTAKTNISYLDASSTDAILDAIGTLKIAQYRYKIESSNDPLRLGLIAEEAPSSVLSLDGKGVDIYKLSTFTLAGVQALAAKVNAQTTRMDSLAARLAKLEDGSVAMARTSSFSTSTLVAAMSDLGVFIERGIAQFGTIVADQFVAATASDGASSAGQGTILSGNTVLEIPNRLVKPTSKIFVTFTSPVEGGWYVTDKKDGSFRIELSKTQTVDASFDYFLIQTEGQIATSTASSNLAGAGAASGGSDSGTSSDHAVPHTTNIVIIGDSTTTGSDTGTAGTGGVSADAPTVTLTGDAAVNITVGDTWTDPGATAHDPADGDLTSQISVRGTVNTAVAGLYTITYAVTDSKGLTGNASRVVNVAAPGSSSSGSSSSSGGDSSAPPAPAPTPDTTPAP